MSRQRGSSMDQIDMNGLFVPNYGDRALSFVRGRGSYLIDAQGKRYLDFSGGIAVNQLGHCHPALVAALRRQAGRLWHVSNWWLNDPCIALAQELIQRTFAGRVFLCNSGLEANEAALKLARKYGRAVGGVKKHKILCFEGAFHGRSLFTAAISGKPQHRKPFAPLPSGIVRCPYDDLVTLRQAMNDHVCALIVEPIQGERGVYPASRAFLQEARRLCDKYEALLIFDEIQSGMGRTGKLFAYMDYQVMPDLMTCAKAMGGGFPIGALLVDSKYGEVLSPGSHGSTFGGNPLAAVVALEALRLTDDAALLRAVTKKSNLLFKQLQNINKQYQAFSEIRVKGLWFGASLTARYDGKALMRRCQEMGLLVILAGEGDVLRLAPPLILSDEDLQKGVDILRRALAI